MLFQLLDYVEEIYQVILGVTPEQLKSAQNTLKEMTQPPMNTMLNKQPAIEAGAKRTTLLFWINQTNIANFTIFDVSKAD